MAQNKGKSLSSKVDFINNIYIFWEKKREPKLDQNQTDSMFLIKKIEQN
jgi:hypothetical protein